MFEIGLAQGSADHARPITHLVIQEYFAGWETWCGGGRAMTTEHVALDHPRRCPRCGVLARRELTQGTPTIDEVETLHRFLGDLVDASSEDA
jgi:hypothetical protein